MFHNSRISRDSFNANYTNKSGSVAAYSELLWCIGCFIDAILSIREGYSSVLFYKYYAGPAFAHGTTGAKRTVDAPPNT
jgi:hypothetical protein